MSKIKSVEAFLEQDLNIGEYPDNGKVNMSGKTFKQLLKSYGEHVRDVTVEYIADESVFLKQETSEELFRSIYDLISNEDLKIE